MYAIRKTVGPIASGTRVELVDLPATVRLTHMSKKFRDQNSEFVRELIATDGIFTTDADNLVKLR